MNYKILYQKLLILPLLIIFTYGILFLEVIKYPGFFGNHFYIDAKIIFAVTIFLLIFLNTEQRIMKLIFRINKLLLATLTVTYLGFYLLEGANYMNYVLNKFHFHLDGLILPLLFSLFIFLVEKFKGEVVSNGEKSKVYPVFVLLIVYFMVKNLSYSLEMAVSRTSYILFHTKSSYDQKMVYHWGVFYEYMMFIKSNTPKDATIVIPPESGAWLMGTGEPNFVRAFLFPRKIVQGQLTIPDENIKSLDKNTYLMISWGQEVCSPDPDCHGWPKQKINASEIVFKKTDSSDISEVRKNMIYDPADKTYVYGLIKVN